MRQSSRIKYSHRIQYPQFLFPITSKYVLKKENTEEITTEKNGETWIKVQTSPNF